MVKGTPSRQVAQTPWARSRSTLAGSGTKAAKNQRPSTGRSPRPFGCLCNLTRLRAIGYLLTFTSLYHPFASIDRQDDDGHFSSVLIPPPRFLPFFQSDKILLPDKILLRQEITFLFLRPAVFLNVDDRIVFKYRIVFTNSF